MTIFTHLCSFAIIMALGLFVPTAQAGSVSSLSRSTTLTDANGDAYQQISVTCSHVSDARDIVSKAGQRQWCSGSVEAVCGNDKLAAAKKVCSAKFDRLLRDTATAVVDKPAQTSVPASLPAEEDDRPIAEPEVRTDSPAALSLEERRLQLDKQRLELRRQELELRKQQLELEQSQTD